MGLFVIAYKIHKYLLFVYIIDNNVFTFKFFEYCIQ
jgi:hypothetical protein